MNMNELLTTTTTPHTKTTLLLTMSSSIKFIDRQDRQARSIHTVQRTQLHTYRHIMQLTASNQVTLHCTKYLLRLRGFKLV